MSLLSDKEKERYHRQMILPEWGDAVQQKLRDSIVCIAGTGGLGSPLSMYLAAAGVGTLRICDDGDVELSNLNRQLLHSDESIGKRKILSAERMLHRTNPHINVIQLENRITVDSVPSLVGEAGIIVDCLDNFETRYILNEYSVGSGVPLVHAGVTGYSGQISFLHPPETACLCCIVPEPPPKELFPIIGATAGVIGSLQALEVIKYLTGSGKLLTNRLLVWDGESMEFFEIAVEKNPECTVCSNPR